MAKPILVERDLDDAGRVLNALAQAKFKVHEAFWYYRSESERWKLALRAPMVKKEGPSAAYDVVNSALAGLDPPSNLVMGDIHLVGNQQEMRHVLQSGPSFEIPIPRKKPRVALKKA